MDQTATILYRRMSSRKNRLKSYLPAAGLFAIWFFFLWRMIVVFDPSSINTMFNSDSSYTVLMPNQDRAITLFDYYAYGQDRWGALPFLLGRIFHRLSGYHWTVQSMHAYQV